MLQSATAPSGIGANEFAGLIELWQFG